MNKRAQAAGLIGLITLMLVLYILFIPPEERKELLAEEKVPGVPGGIPGVGESIFHATPGRLTYLGQTEFTHLIPNLVLTEERQAKILAETNPFTITKGWFRKNFKTIDFILPDAETVDNLLLSFQTPINTGTLKIIFNKVPVFEGDIGIQNPPPILLPKNLIKAENTIEFQVWGFGLIFPRKYQFQDVKVIGEIIDIKKQQSANAFSIPDAEYENIESGYLGFYPICDQDNAGLLEILLNDKIIYSAVPVCDNPTRQDLFKEDLKSGKNTLGFRLKSGTARIEQIMLKTLVKPTKGFSDFFFIEPDVYTAIAIGKAHAVLEIKFVDDGKIKEAQTNINGRLDVLSQRDPTFIRDISAVVKDGNNFIAIDPLSDLNIISTEVRVE